MNNIGIRNIEKIRINIYESIGTFLVSLSLISIIVAAIVPLPGQIRNVFITVVGLSCYVYSIIASKNKNIIRYSFYIALVMTGAMLLSIMYNGNASLGELIWVWVYMGIALCIYLFKINHRTITLIFYFFSVYLIIVAFIGISPDKVFNGSQNAASALTILLVSISYYIAFQNNAKISVFPIVIQSIISIWGVGRAGIVSSLFMIVLITFYIIQSKKHKLRNFLVLLMAFIFFYIFITFYFGYFTENTLVRFSSLGLKSTRLLIYEEYISGLKSNIGHLFFGVPYDYGFYLNSHQNPHNFLLELHSKYGAIGFLLIFILLIKAVFNLINKNKYFYVIIFFTLSIRSFFDWTSFPGAYDIMWFLFILTYLDFKKIKCNFPQYSSIDCKHKN